MSNKYYDINLLQFIAVVDLLLCNGKVLNETDFCNSNSNNIFCPEFLTTNSSGSCDPMNPVSILTPEEQNITVDALNNFRNEVAGGNYSMPTAASMTEMIWDSYLAKAAEVKLNLCIQNHLNVSSRTFGKITAKAMHFTVYNYIEISRVFDFKSWKFNGKNIDNYNLDRRNDIVSMIMYHKSIFVGCAKKVFHGTDEHVTAYIICYLADSGTNKEKPERVLYKRGKPCTDCPFKHLNYSCSEKHPNLCSRPPWTLADYQVQNPTFFDGFKSTTIPSPTNATSTNAEL